MTTFVPARRKIVRSLAAAPLVLLAAVRLTPSALAASGTANQAADSTQGGTDYRIEIHNFVFMPNEIHVPVGARVVWTNRDDEPHTIVSKAGAFKASRALDTDDSYATVLDKPGTYAYFCGIHPMMVGKIVVR